MQKIGKTMETEIVCDDENQHTFSVTKRLVGEEGESALLIGLYPTLGENDAYHLDSTLKGLSNHLEELGLNEITICNLFSKRLRFGARLSAKGLEVDEDNLKYIEGLLNQKNRFQKVILAWGSSMSSCSACNQAKDKVFQILEKTKKGEKIYQMDCDNLDLEDNLAPHVLYMGIRHSTQTWYLTPFPVEKYRSLRKEKLKRTDEVIKRKIKVINQKANP